MSFEDRDPEPDDHRGHAGLELAGNRPGRGQNLCANGRRVYGKQDGSRERVRRMMQGHCQEQGDQAGEEAERGEGHEGAECCGEERAALVARHRDALRSVVRARF